GFWKLGAIVLYLIGACLVVAYLFNWDFPELNRDLVGGCILLILLCSTPWALGCYAATALWLLRIHGGRFQFGLGHLLGATGWLVAHVCAWRVSYVLMMQEYSRLPKTPPGCFVCTAAARGHPWLVGSREYRLADGAVCRMNDQLRRLKAFELLLLC